MPILDTFRKDSWGSWKSLADFAEALEQRDAAALTALGAALGMAPPEQKELGAAAAPVLIGVAGDLKVQKGARLAATRCALEAGADEKQLADLFLAAGDLLTDPRLGSKAKALAEGGIPAALKLRREFDKVSAAAGDFARAAFASSSVVGASKVKGLLGAAAAGNAGANAARFTLGEPLPEAEKKLWQALLTDQCGKNRKAPAAAKRLGLVPPWPPFLPEAFAPLIAAAEEATKTVATTDALATNRPPAPPKGSKVIEAPAGAVPARSAPPLSAAAAAGVGSPPAAAPSDPAATPPAPAPGRNFSTQVLSTGAKAMAPLNRAQPRPSTAVLMEGPATAATVDPVANKRTMPAILPRQPGVAHPLSPEAAKAALQKAAAIAHAQQTGEKLAGAVFDPMAGVAELEKQPLTARLSGQALQQLAVDRGVTLPDGRTYKGSDPLSFDARGKRIPRSDRWRDTAFGWQEPLLPASAMRKPANARPVDGPFAARLKSLFDDRPEAVDRLCAAAEARAALAGDEGLQVELARELALPRWRKKRAAPAQLERLRALAQAEGRPAASRAAAGAVLSVIDRPPEGEPG